MRKKFIVLMLILCTFISVNGYASEIQTSSPDMLYSEHCTPEDINTAKKYMQENYKYLLEHAYDEIRTYQMEFKEAVIQNLTLGEPFMGYNVDGKQYAALYFPLYNEGDAVGIIHLVNYGKRWQVYDEYCGCELSGIYNLLDEVDYANKDTIIYTINTTCYVETRDKCVTKCLFQLSKEQKTAYSKEEAEFMSLSWSDKKQQVEEGYNSIVAFSSYEWCNTDADYSKYEALSGSGGNVEDKSVTEDKKEDEDKSLLVLVIAAAGGVIIAGITGVIIRKKHQKNKNNM